MSVEEGTAILGIIVIFMQSVGAWINNKRYNAIEIRLAKFSGDISLKIMDAVAPLRERVAVIEATHRRCPTAINIKN
jgi:hypothetical protein